MLTCISIKSWCNLLSCYILNVGLFFGGGKRSMIKYWNHPADARMIRHGCKYPTCKINASLCDEVTVPSIDPRARWVSRTSPSAGTNPTASVRLLSYPSNSIATIVSIGYRVHLRLSWRCKLLPPFFATPSLIYVWGGALHYRLFALITEYQPCRFDFFFFYL